MVVFEKTISNFISGVDIFSAAYLNDRNAVNTSVTMRTVLLIMVLIGLSFTISVKAGMSFRKFGYQNSQSMQHRFNTNPFSVKL